VRASATARRLTLSCTTPAWWSRPARPVTPVWRRRRKGRRRWRRWWGGCWRGTQVWSSTGGLQRCSGHERAFFFGAIFSRTSKNDHSICQDRLRTHVGRKKTQNGVRSVRFLPRKRRSAAIGSVGTAPPRSSTHRSKRHSAPCRVRRSPIAYFVKMIILPRQPRDKHRESTQNRVPFSCTGVRKLDGYAWTLGKCGDYDDATHHSMLAFDHVVTWLRDVCAIG
jgi:hypothetical protein